MIAWPEPSDQAVEELARAWHHEACKLRRVSLLACRWRKYHLASARDVLLELNGIPSRKPVHP